MTKPSILKLWRSGQDTLTIAERLGFTEAEVCKIIAWDQDCRRAARRRQATLFAKKARA